MLTTFWAWIEEIMIDECGWPVLQVKFVGENFDLIVFVHADHRDLALSSAPWFYIFIFVLLVLHHLKPRTDVISSLDLKSLS